MTVVKWVFSLFLPAFFFFPVCSAQVSVEQVEKRIKDLGLSTFSTKEATVYFDKPDSIRGREFEDLSSNIVRFYEQHFGISYNLKVAALEPRNWFSEFPGIPYAVPWPYFPDRIIMMPSSLTEGIMINPKRSRQENKWFVDFVLIHEYSHFLEKDYFRPADKNDYISVKWFGEFIANYFAYAYIYSVDSAWAAGAKNMWRENLKAYTPNTFSLDWSFMNNLPPQELGPTYAWYQVMLNLKAAELYEKDGLKFLHTLKAKLPWHQVREWNTQKLLTLLETFYPGFEEWSENIESYSRLD